mmetsp:Transcript_1174/g.1377  ORF Transcript_1174/g.1377 Transcript_1174/m.1377 type:complete len:235 (-) Transcript_1174:1363-2067(-)
MSVTISLRVVMAARTTSMGNILKVLRMSPSSPLRSVHVTLIKQWSGPISTTTPSCGGSSSALSAISPISLLATSLPPSLSEMDSLGTGELFARSSAAASSSAISSFVPPLDDFEFDLSLKNVGLGRLPTLADPPFAFGLSPVLPDRALLSICIFSLASVSALNLLSSSISPFIVSICRSLSSSSVFIFLIILMVSARTTYFDLRPSTPNVPSTLAGSALSPLLRTPRMGTSWRN